MARTNVGSHAWRRHLSTDLYIIQPTAPGDTTVTPAVLGDGTETTLTVASAASFTVADPAFIIGDGGVELVKIGTPATSMPISYKPKLPQSAGARFVEALKVSLGKTSEDGFVITPTKSLTPVFSSVDDFAVFYIDSPIEIQCGFSLLEYAGKNMQLMLGYADEETGVGSAADPFQNVIGKLNQTLQGYAVIRHTGQLQDGKFVQIDMLDARFEASQGITHARKAPPPSLPISIKINRAIWREATTAFTN